MSLSVSRLPPTSGRKTLNVRSTRLDSARISSTTRDRPACPNKSDRQRRFPGEIVDRLEDGHGWPSTRRRPWSRPIADSSRVSASSFLLKSASVPEILAFQFERATSISSGRTTRSYISIKRCAGVVVTRFGRPTRLDRRQSQGDYARRETKKRHNEPLPGRLPESGRWGGSCTATPGRQYNFHPNKLMDVTAKHRVYQNCPVGGRIAASATQRRGSEKCRSPVESRLYRTARLDNNVN